MNLYDIAIARKLSGGGGSSDFSTATVTVVNNGATPSTLYMPYIVTGEGEDIRATTELFLMDNDTTQVSVILYKGTGDLIFPDGDSGVVITGSAEKIDDSYYFITGDCTITIS